MSEVCKLQELEYGDIKIADNVLAIIANIAANEIDGVAELKSGILPSFGKKNTRGVKVNSECKTVELDLSIIIQYGSKIQEVATKVQKIVKENIEVMTELNVEAVNIHVNGVAVKEKDKASKKSDE